MMNKQLVTDLKKIDPELYNQIQTFLLLGEAAKAELKYKVPNEPETAVLHALSLVGEQEVCDTIRTPEGTRFLVVTPGTMKAEERTSFVLGDESYDPFPIEEINEARLILPTRALPYGTVADLDAKIVAFLRKYIHTPGFPDEVLVTYVRATWLPEWHDTFPILRLIGLPGSGKSQILKVVGGLCRHAVQTNGSSTEAALRRRLDKFPHCVALIDEAEYDPKSPSSVKVRQMQKLGFHRGAVIDNCTESKERRDKGQRVDAFHVAGFKISAAIDHDKDLALMTRCIPLYTEEDFDGRVPYELPDEFEAERDELQGMLLQYRLDHVQIKPPMPARIDLRGRFHQVRSPLARVAQPSQMEAIDEFIRDLDNSFESGLQAEERLLIRLGHIIGGGELIEPGEPIPYEKLVGADLVDVMHVGRVVAKLGIKHGRPRVNGKRGQAITASWEELRALLEKKRVS